MRGDETPMKAGAKTAVMAQEVGSAVALAEEILSEPVALEGEVGPQKVVQTEWLGSALYELPGGQHLLLSFPLVTWSACGQDYRRMLQESIRKGCADFRMRRAVQPQGAGPELRQGWSYPQS